MRLRQRDQPVMNCWLQWQQRLLMSSLGSAHQFYNQLESWVLEVVVSWDHLAVSNHAEYVEAAMTSHFGPTQLHKSPTASVDDLQHSYSYHHEEIGERLVVERFCRHEQPIFS